MTPSEKKPSTTRLATAVPGALGAVLLIGAVAFGASSLRSAARESAAPAAASVPDAEPQFGSTVAALRRNEFKQDPNPHKPAKTEAPKATEAPEAEAKVAEQPKAEPTAEPKPAPVETKKPAPAPTVKPAPAPTNPAALVLEAWAKETKAKLAWTPFSGEGFEYFKVVRSADAHVTWPASGDDQVVGVIGDPNAPWYVDKPACGVTWNYAVFAVRHGDGGYVTLAASNGASVTTACAPAPAPIVVKPLAFQLNVGPGAGITLSWEACWSDGFIAYKIVRSAVNADPRYPLNDGTELIGVIGDPNATVFTDTAVAAGQTWIYRVVAVTDQGAGYVPLCETAAMSATAQ